MSRSSPIRQVQVTVFAKSGRERVQPGGYWEHGPYADRGIPVVRWFRVDVLEAKRTFGTLADDHVKPTEVASLAPQDVNSIVSRRFDRPCSHTEYFALHRTTYSANFAASGDFATCEASTPHLVQLEFAPAATRLPQYLSSPITPRKSLLFSQARRIRLVGKVLLIGRERWLHRRHFPKLMELSTRNRVPRDSRQAASRARR
jgi:hypothetical protein